MARVLYLRMGQFVGKTPIPERGDIPGMAVYWKKYYNTECPNLNRIGCIMSNLIS